MRSRLAIIVLAFAAVAFAVVASRGAEPSGESEKPSAQPSASPTADPGTTLPITLVYSPEKKGLMAPLVERFNAERHRSGGRTVVVEARDVASGDVQARIAAGTLQPTMWSPASSFWGRLLNYEADRRLVADDNPVDRAHAARHRDVEGAGRRLRVSAQADGLPGARRAGHAGLGRGRQAGVRRVQVRAHEPRLLDVRPLCRRRVLLRRGRQARGTDAGGRAGGPAQGPPPRALDRPLRRHDALHRGPDAGARARVRVGRRDGGDDADRLQPRGASPTTGSSRSIRRRGRSTRTTRS